MSFILRHKRFFIVLFLFCGSGLPVFAGEGHGVPVGDLLLRALNLAILFGGVAYFFGKNITSAFASRREGIDRAIHEAADELEQAKAELERVEKELSNLSEIKESILAEASKRAEEESREIVRRAERRAEMIVSSAEKAAAVEAAALKQEILLNVIDGAVSRALGDVSKQSTVTKKRTEELAGEFAKEIAGRG